MRRSKNHRRGLPVFVTRLSVCEKFMEFYVNLYKIGLI